MIPKKAMKLLAMLEDAGYEAYLAGGCVRDMLMGLAPSDYDIATSAEPHETKAVFREYHTIDTGIAHGTVTVVLDGEPFEVTTFRAEEGYSDSRHPDAVRFLKTVEGDLARRDFTANAMAMGKDGNVIDLFGGKEDIEQGIIRCVGDPYERFSEDALRILRALRFASKLGFAIHPDTAFAAKELRDTVKAVSAERIFSEISKMLLGKAAGRVIKEHREILAAAMPRLLTESLDAAADAIDRLPSSLPLRFAALFAGSEDAPKRLNSTLLGLRSDNATRLLAVKLLQNLDMRILPVRHSVDSAMYKLGAEDFFLLLELKRACFSPYGAESTLNEIEAIGRSAIAEGRPICLRDLAIGGRDLLALGFRGPEVGHTLEDIMESVLLGIVQNEKEKLLGLAGSMKKDRP